MNGNTQTLKQERVIFFDGQRLTAGDLTAAQDGNQTIRWLHHRSLHNWGIGFGLVPTGDKGAREVAVAPGYALDTVGREIVLAEAQILPVPPLAGENGQPAIRDLTIAYPTDDEVEVVETRAGICLPRGAVRLSEAPPIRWLETREVRTGFDIVLARAHILNCQLDESLSTAQRRNAHSIEQPYIACGQTPKGQTVWKQLVENVSGTEIVLGYKVKVDTSTARFRDTPYYLARAAGERFADLALRERLQIRWPNKAWNNLKMPSLVEGFSSVVEAGPASFALQVLLAPRHLTIQPEVILNPNSWSSTTGGRPELAELALQAIWHVVWIGIEG